MLPRVSESTSNFAASLNREEDWQQCCASVMGFEWIDRFQNDIADGALDEEDESQIHSNNIQQVIDLMDSEEEVQKTTLISCPWTENALRIQGGLNQMSRWIQSKQREYVGLDMPDDEASLIQSTVTSFAATTASEIETLRKIIPNSRDNVASHRAGIVQILLTELQEQVTKPFASLQLQRTRISVKIWQHPWQCKLYQRKNLHTNESKSSRMLQLFDDEMDGHKEQRFLPRQPLHRGNQRDFLSKYADDHTKAEAACRPAFISRMSHSQRVVESVEGPTSLSRLQPIQPMAIKPTIVAYDQPTTEESREQLLQEELQQEAALLMVKMVNSDLDSVQKMEQRMAEITTLIGQFSNLVSEQQEDIWDIAKNAEKTKENMDKGQENLIDATERTKRSKHYLAWTIFALSMILLFFHTLRN